MECLGYACYLLVTGVWNTTDDCITVLPGSFELRFPTYVGTEWGQGLICLMHLRRGFWLRVRASAFAAVAGGGAAAAAAAVFAAVALLCSGRCCCCCCCCDRDRDCNCLFFFTELPSHVFLLG